MSLDDISHRGRFCVLAIDHRDSLRKFLSPADLDAVSAGQLTSLKTDIVRELAPMATGVMLEPEYSIPQVADSGASEVAVDGSLHKAPWAAREQAKPC